MGSAFLILADGTVFEGQSMGASGKTVGEVVFTTGMTGYLETLTDPSYYGQIVTQTFPLIGNYGVINQDFESKKTWVRGYIVRELCEKPSNFRCEENLDEFLKKQNIVGICGIDTRALTKKLRDAGVMNGMILSSDEKPSVTEKLLEEIRSYTIKDALKNVQDNNKRIGSCLTTLTEKVKDVSPEQIRLSNKKYSVCLFDFGAKANIQRELEKRGCNVTVVPFDTSAETVLNLNPDGIMLSNGPGDPAENVEVIEQIKKLCDYGKIPIFGICLGHQMLALARGATTSKLKYGHRGGNHPCKDLSTGRVYITSQNHGYAVDSESLMPTARLSFVNVNDGTVEGIEYTDISAFSVQFHPEACGGPHDTNFLFDKFVGMM